MKPFISVIIPTYQRCDKLKITIESVISQTYNNYEVLIMDDGSTDGTKEMINEFKDPRIFYNWQKNTGGPGNPRNNGIKIAKGEWIALLDDDDIWRQNKLNEISKVINENNDFIYHDYSLIVSNKFTEEKLIKSSYLKNPKFMDLLMNGNRIGLSTVVVRKKLLLKVNGFNEDVSMAPCADYNTWLKISQLSENFFYLPKNLGYYKVDEYNMSNQDMTISKRLAVSEFLHHLSTEQRLSLEAKFNYQSAAYNFSKKNYNVATSFFWASLKHGNLFIKIKSLFRILQTTILKAIE